MAFGLGSQAAGRPDYAQLLPQLSGRAAAQNVEAYGGFLLTHLQEPPSSDPAKADVFSDGIHHRVLLQKEKRAEVLYLQSYRVSALHSFIYLD